MELYLTYIWYQKNGHSFIHSFYMYLLSNCYLQHYFFNKFNWRIIAFQYCDGFCHTSTWITHRYICVPSILKPPSMSLSALSLWVVPEHQFWVPFFMHQTCTGHLFTYGNVHISVLFSQIIPPSPSPTGSKSLFFISVSPLCAALF